MSTGLSRQRQTVTSMTHPNPAAGLVRQPAVRRVAARRTGTLEPGMASMQRNPSGLAGGHV
jgi:hypothetical protein